MTGYTASLMPELKDIGIGPGSVVVEECYGESKNSTDGVDHDFAVADIMTLFLFTLVFCRTILFCIDKILGKACKVNSVF